MSSPRRLLSLALLALALALVSCSDRSSKDEAEDEGSLRPRRFHPPPARVRAVPPHNIHDGGMGPYELDMKLKEVLDLLPHGPRVELVAVEDLFDYNLVRAEGESLLIGATRGGGVAFVSALDPEVARTETGVGVGARRAELDRALGTLDRREDVARDPRIRVYVALEDVRFVMGEGEVEAVVAGRAVHRESGGAAPTPARDGGVPPTSSRCSAESYLAPHEAEILDASRLPRRGFVGGGLELDYGCFEGGQGAVVSGDDRIALVLGPPDRPRRVAAAPVAGLVFAGAIDIDGDGRQEVAAVSRKVSPSSQVVRVDLYRAQADQLVSIAGEDVYRLSSSAAALVGARLSDVEFLAELHASPEAVHVGGLFLQRAGGSIRNLVPLETETLSVRRARPASPRGADAGPDGGLKAPLLPPPPKTDGG